MNSTWTQAICSILPTSSAPDGTGTAERNTGAIRAMWAARLGSLVYDNAQLVARCLLAAWQLPLEWRELPAGGVALDVGSGPGNVTAALGRAAGPGGPASGRRAWAPSSGSAAGGRDAVDSTP